MASVEKNDDLDISQRTYKKLSNKITKTGYVEGISDGKDSVFQEGFDIGYANGFKTAFLTGQYKGRLAAINALKEFQTPSLCDCIKRNEGDLILVKTSRGQCQICTEKELINEDMAKVTEIQARHTMKVHTTLKEKYKEIDECLDD